MIFKGPPAVLAKLLEFGFTLGDACNFADVSHRFEYCVRGIQVYSFKIGDAKHKQVLSWAAAARMN